MYPQGDKIIKRQVALPREMLRRSNVTIKELGKVIVCSKGGHQCVSRITVVQLRAEFALPALGQSIQNCALSVADSSRTLYDTSVNVMVTRDDKKPVHRATAGVGEVIEPHYGGGVLLWVSSKCDVTTNKDRRDRTELREPVAHVLEQSSSIRAVWVSVRSLAVRRAKVDVCDME